MVVRLELIGEPLASASALLLPLPAWRLSRDLLAIKRDEQVTRHRDKVANFARKFSVASSKGDETFDRRTHRQLLGDFALTVGSAFFTIVRILTK